MSKRRGGHGAHGASHERWLLTYADMITLLLVLFIVLLAMAEINAKKFETLGHSMRSAFHATAGGSEAVLQPGSKDVLSGGGAAILPEQQALMEIQERFDQIMAQKQGAGSSEQAITTSLTDRGLVLSLANTVFFNAGEASIRPQVRDLLATVAGTIKDSGRNVMIEGHTDNTPISTARFPSNWELSTSRATEVVKALITDYGLPPKRLSAAGYGEYYPVAPNTTEANRARNRRVDIVILRGDLQGMRPGE